MTTARELIEEWQEAKFVYANIGNLSDKETKEWRDKLERAEDAICKRLLAQPEQAEPVGVRVKGDMYVVAPPQDVVRDALTKSVELQSHYARLLNIQDGGTRMTFGSAQDWIDRLADIAEEAK